MRGSRTSGTRRCGRVCDHPPGRGGSICCPLTTAFSSLRPSWPTDRTTGSSAVIRRGTRACVAQPLRPGIALQRQGSPGRLALLNSPPRLEPLAGAHRPRWVPASLRPIRLRVYGAQRWFRTRPRRGDRARQQRLQRVRHGGSSSGPTRSRRSSRDRGSCRCDAGRRRGFKLCRTLCHARYRFALPELPVRGTADRAPA